MTDETKDELQQAATPDTALEELLEKAKKPYEFNKGMNQDMEDIRYQNTKHQGREKVKPFKYTMKDQLQMHKYMK